MLATVLEAGAAIAIEPIHAWRTWSLEGSRDGAEIRLLPIAGDGRSWPARSPAAASCAHRRSHRPPSLHCTCGLHAMREPDPLRRTRAPAVLGTVALWGRVVEHALGFRAEFGYPQRLRLICYLCFSLWGTRAPSESTVVVRHRGGRMVPLCEPHLELSRRYDYRMPRLLDARQVQRALSSSYAVDLLPVP